MMVIALLFVIYVGMSSICPPLCKNVTNIIYIMNEDHWS